MKKEVRDEINKRIAEYKSELYSDRVPLKERIKISAVIKELKRLRKRFNKHAK